MPQSRNTKSRNPKSRNPKLRKGDHRGLIAAFGAVAALLLLAGGYLWLLGGPSPPRAAAIGGPFQLTTSDGRPVTERSFQGRYLLIYFGYTACRDECPTTLSAVGNALDALGSRAARIQPLFITVDPSRDTPDVLRRYVSGFAPGLVGLTGTPGQLRRVQQEYRVVSIRHPAASGPAASGTADYTVDHNSVLYLVGPDGGYLAPIRADQNGSDMAADIARYI